MDVVEALGLRYAQALEQAEDDERGQPLRGRRRVVERARRQRQRERLAQLGAIVLEVAPRDRAADALEVGGDLAADVAAIEVVEPGVGEVVERVGERALAEHRAFGGRLAVDEERRGEAGYVLELRELVSGEARLAARHRNAVARVTDRRREQPLERHPAAECARRLVRQRPAADRTGHRERRERPARRDRLMLAIEIAPRLLARKARRLDRADATPRLAEQPEAVAADVIHVRIDGGDRGRHRDHGFDRVAAFGEHVAAGFGGGAMRRTNDGASMSSGMNIHGRNAGPGCVTDPRALQRELCQRKSGNYVSIRTRMLSHHLTTMFKIALSWRLRPPMPTHRSLAG